MKKKSRALLFFLFVFFGLILTGYFNSIFAQTEKKKKDSAQEIIKETSNTSTYNLFKKKKDCVENFNINSTNFKNPGVTKYSYLLTDFFLCKASIRDNVNECDKLSSWPNRMEACKSYFNHYQGFLGRLLRDGRPTSQVMYVLTTVLKKPKEEVDGLIQAILNRDSSVCERCDSAKNKNCCIAMATRDIKYSEDKNCKDRVMYIRAIENGNIKECEQIKNPSIVLMCKAYISMDEKVCEASKGYKDFCDNTCEDTIRRKQP